uniref:Uncharacterized protein n=1 Tax=Lactuca sativa TaxID=4236 RepID=A0A9R1XF20_LACSA|nr:hypothetical protein LSAT_V11C400171380 [Lactuca sativa]
MARCHAELDSNSCQIPWRLKASDLDDDKLHYDIKSAEKHTALHSNLSEHTSDFDGESMLFLQRFFRTRVKPIVSTGPLKLDLALGIRGLPKALVRVLSICFVSDLTE